MNPLLEQFISETRDLLETTGNGLLALEKNPDSPDLINELFRAVHTIKGSSGLFDLKPITQVVHAAEDLLDAVRDQTLHFTSEMSDILLESFDLIATWIDLLEKQNGLPPNSEAPASRLAAHLRQFLPVLEAQSEASSDSAEPILAPLSEDWIGRIEETDRLAMVEAVAASSEKTLWHIHYIPEEQCFFTGEDPLFVARNTPELKAFSVQASQPWPSLADFDPYLANLTFSLLSVAPRDALETHFQYMRHTVRIEPLPIFHLACPVGEENGGPVYDDFIEDALDCLARNDYSSLEKGIAALEELSSATLWVASALRWLRCLMQANIPNAVLGELIQSLHTQRAPDWAHFVLPEENSPSSEEATPSSAVASNEAQATSLNARGERILQEEDKQHFLDFLKTQLTILEIPVEPAHWSGRIQSMSKALKNAFHFMGREDLFEELEESEESAIEHRSSDALRNLIESVLEEWTLESEAATLPVVAARPAASVSEETETAVPDLTERERGLNKVLKIDQAKIDTLMDLIGEMVVAKNSLPYLAQRADQTYGVRELSREIKDQYTVINRISQEMQSAIMQVRMMPVSNIFQRFSRLVRDISRKLNKKINLVIEGEETEADKNIIEALSDPLIHLVRNSLDHGIELPAERVAAGKPEEGTLKIRAYPDNDRVMIQISDDGKGIDPEVIKRKAYEKGILPEERLHTLSDQDAIQLVFAAGFSTAETISDISGRGVGMDVVRTAVEKAGGLVRLSSQKGQGTMVTLSLPLSMAVTQVMVVEVGGQLFGVPMERVAETVKVPVQTLHTIKHQEAFVLRDRIVPLVRLGEALGLSQTGEETQPVEELATLVVRVGSDDIGVVVDDFHEGVEILLKPMEGFLAELGTYAGTALLGDGTVLLILNIKALLEGAA